MNQTYRQKTYSVVTSRKLIPHLFEHRGPVRGVEGADMGDVPAQATVDATTVVT